MGQDAQKKGVLLAMAIILLWLAGFAFFIAFEGSKLLGEVADPNGAGLWKAIVTGAAQHTLDFEGGAD